MIFQRNGSNKFDSPGCEWGDEVEPLSAAIAQDHLLDSVDLVAHAICKYGGFESSVNDIVVRISLVERVDQAEHVAADDDIITIKSDLNVILVTEVEG